VVTDGVTEAMNESGQMYGVSRLRAVLQSLPADVSPVRLLSAVRADVGSFVGTAEVSDDLTLLCVRWNGRITPTSGDAVLANADLDAPVAGLGDLVVGPH
jgi:sigma-B regulation protein RsbU (phosphoserine phosphatase)